MKTIFAILMQILLIAPLAYSQSATPRVLVVSPELGGVFQTGGLAHATTGLVEALNSAGIRAEILMPFYLSMNTPSGISSTSQNFNVALDWRNGQAHKNSQFTTLVDRKPEFTTFYLKHLPAENARNYFDNRPSPGQTRKTYGPEETIGESFGAFAKAAADFILQGPYNVVVLNDWTTGLIATHLQEAKERGLKVPKVVFAIHNIAYQGVFPKSLVDFLGISQKHFQIEGYEYYGQVNFLKAGLMYSDLTYTVSPQYAQEISTPRFGMGLDGVIRKLQSLSRMTGILNGIDNSEWDPSRTNKHPLPVPFSANDPSGKAKGKKMLQEKFGLTVQAETPLFILTSRLAEQKGFEYLIEALDQAVQRAPMQILIIGDGEPQYVKKAQELEARYPGKVRYSAFSNEGERLATAYGDFFLNGAWFEPCGLNQFFAMKNGTIPVVSRVGGLMSSVKAGVTGFLVNIAEGPHGSSYDAAQTSQNISKQLVTAAEMYRRDPEAIRKMRWNGMKEDHSWANRVQAEFRPLFDFVVKNGSQKIQHRARPISSDKIPTVMDLHRAAGLQDVSSSVKSCSVVHRKAG